MGSYFEYDLNSEQHDQVPGKRYDASEYAYNTIYKFAVTEIIPIKI